MDSSFSQLGQNPDDSELESTRKKLFSGICDYRMEQVLEDPNFEERAILFLKVWNARLNNNTKQSGEVSTDINRSHRKESFTKENADCQGNELVPRRASILARTKIRKDYKFLNVRRKDDCLKRRRKSYKNSCRPRNKFVSERSLPIVMAHHKIAKNNRKWELQEKIWEEEEERKQQNNGRIGVLETD